jgi:hypothetical protein
MTKPVTSVAVTMLVQDQCLPFHDADAIATLQGFERRVYQGLRH